MKAKTKKVRNTEKVQKRPTLKSPLKQGKEKEVKEIIASLQIMLNRLKAAKEDKVYVSLMRSEIDKGLYRQKIEDALSRAYTVLESNTYAAKVIYFSSHQMYGHLPEDDKKELMPAFKVLLEKIKEKETEKQ